MPKKFVEVSGRFGKLVVLHCKLPPRKRVLVKCDCGKEFAVSSYDLRNGRTSSCGSPLCSTKAIDLTDKRFGSLVVKNILSKKNKRGKLLWVCICDCGNERNVSCYDLTHGIVTNCGCTLNIRIYDEPLSVNNNDKLICSLQIYKNYENSALRRDIKFNLQYNQFIKFLFDKCHYCGSLPIGRFSIIESVSKKRIVLYNGIDRKNPDKDYSLENCVTCCKLCNWSKRDMQYEDFIALISKIFNNLIFPVDDARISGYI